MQSKEDVTQGEALAIISYVIGVLPLIFELWGAHPHVTQPWYVDDAGAGGKFTHILAHLRDFQARGLPRSYFLEPTKSILVMAPRSVAWAEEFFHGMGIKVVTGNRYLEGFIREREEEKIWMDGKVAGWAESVDVKTYKGSLGCTPPHDIAVVCG